MEVAAALRRRALFLPRRKISSASESERFCWAPGRQASQPSQGDDEKCWEKLAGKIRSLCTERGGWCVIGARGETATANAMRSLAWASEIGLSPVVFKVRWHEEPKDERSLRFYCSIHETWREWKQRWSVVKTPEKPLIVTPHTFVDKLSIATSMRQRKFGGAAIEMRVQHDPVLSTAAKALATLPSTAREELADDLSCVIRWPSFQQEKAGKTIYGHVMLHSPKTFEGFERLDSQAAVVDKTGVERLLQIEMSDQVQSHKGTLHGHFQTHETYGL
eukprot:symbB.v1.2.023759.t1/scaffold2149.1/size87894/4